MLITVNPLNPIIKILINNLLSLYIFNRSSGENLLKFNILLDSSPLIMSTILIGPHWHTGGNTCPLMLCYH